MDASDDEGLIALKKAYADIILNTAKEAAARIMVSERKASRYLYDLNAVKEQGVRMLLLVKQMSDSKVNEAEVISMNQQSKIKQLQTELQNAEDMINEGESVSLNQHRKVDELEAQLHEAEDIVKDLREDLRNVRAELDQFNDGKSNSETSHWPTITASQSADGFGSDLSYSYPNQHYLSSQPMLLPQTQKSEISITASDFILKVCKTNMSNLPSIILRRKDGESYRIRRTQRIRAFEEKLTTEESIINKGNVEKECESSSPIKPSYRKRKRANKYKRNLTSTETETEREAVVASIPDKEENCSNDNNNDLQSEKYSPVAESNAEIVKTSGEKLSVSPSKKEPEETDQPVSNRLIRFTFQRKRKKETNTVISSSDGAVEKQIEPVEMMKMDPGLSVTESSHDIRRAAQVARQLISLSEQKWWQ
ncbi:uncharacterized protein LOC124936313 [Impatiens glandulifera]|uniref:uncharacterized protein LOC124936313 n=1 Tax=Impatiens glandulifera TaxID=253017 RepID=UPI001FB176AD|nr:uncharacterized protein LOC124936313 [Impatiens glandulifera]